MNRKITDYSKEDFIKSARICNMTNISLLDISYLNNKNNQHLYKESLETNGFILVNGDKLKVNLDGRTYYFDKIAIVHGRLGSNLLIESLNEKNLEAYIVLYKEEGPIENPELYLSLLEEVNPFNINYCFRPKYPIFFMDLLGDIYEKWTSDRNMDQLYCKGSFYKFVHLVHEDLISNQLENFQYDPVDMALIYMEENYDKALSIKDMSTNLGVSYSHFLRMFKDKTGKSPQEYLINKRIERAIYLLETTNATVREIAEISGFQDERNLQRAFAKKISRTPKSFREKLSHKKIDIDIVNDNRFQYNENSSYSLNELNWKGVNYMLKQMTKEGLVVVALSLLLLLSGCSPKGLDKNSLNSDKVEEIEIVSQENETRIVDTPMGQVEIPVEAKRVISIFIQGDVLALDVIPVGTSFNTGAVFEDDLGASQVIDAFSINPEEIMALDPDLIIWDTDDTEAYETLSKIAPTVAYKYFEMDHKERLRLLGDILNRSDKAEELIKDFDNKIKNAKEKLVESDLHNKTAICMENREDVLHVAWLGRGGPLMYDLLGFKMPEKLEEISKLEENKQSGSVKLSYEVIDQYLGDVVLINGNLGEFGENPVWKNIASVKEERIVFAPSNMFWFNDILSMNGQVDLIIDSLTNK